MPGLARPGLAVWKGDRVAACVAAASVLAKVTRARMMLELHERWPEYYFAGHKGYITDVHSAALERHGLDSAEREVRWAGERLDDAELLRTFNCGIGMIVVAPAASVAEVETALRVAGENPIIMGKIIETDGARVTYAGRLAL